MVWPFSSKKRGVFDDDPDYQQLPVEQQSQLARDYAKEVIQSDPDYIALPKDLQTELLRDYFAENLPKPISTEREPSKVHDIVGARFCPRSLSRAIKNPSGDRFSECAC